METINQDTSGESGSSLVVSVDSLVQGPETLTHTPSYRDVEREAESGVQTMGDRSPNAESRDALRQVGEDDLNEYADVDHLREELT
jgi:hypothetical protein